jgi:hypothetical protein
MADTEVRHMTARAVVARMLAGPDPSPYRWRRAQEMADEIVTDMAGCRVPSTQDATVVRATRRPCAGCKEPIEPGRAYVVDGPYHIRCGA